MHAIWTIAQRELKTFFDSLIAYIILVLFLSFSGFFTWFYGSDIFLVGQADLSAFFRVAYWTLFFFIPALTMRLLAEENKVGTIEVLLTKAVSDRQVVIGKFLAALLLILIALAFTLPYYITIAAIGEIDHGAVWGSYLGLILMSTAYISIGLYASSTTSNQIVAFLVALFISMFFHIIFGVLANNTTGLMGEIFNYLNLATHYDAITKGVLDTRDITYFLSFVVLGTLASELSLIKRKFNES